MTKIKEAIQSDIKFFITIAAIVVSITAWGVRIETRLDNLTSLLEKHDVNETEVIASINRLWKNVVALNTTLKLPTQ